METRKTSSIAKLLICSELTVFVNLGHCVPGRVGNGHIYLKRQFKCMDIGLEPGNVD